MNCYLVGYKYHLPDTFVEQKVSALAHTSYLSGRLNVNRDSPFFPSRGDEKIMREDVKASLILLNELLEELKITSELETTSLFVANGTFIENTEKNDSRMSNMYKNFLAGMSQAEKSRKLYQTIPPLLALETLTNSTMSFLSQYTKLRGQNTTFGNTSIAGFFAVKEAVKSLDKNNYALACSSNAGGDYSFLTNSSIVGFEENWKESAAVSCLYFSNKIEENLPPFCEITKIVNGTDLPVLENNIIDRRWGKLLPDFNADLIIFSGAFSIGTCLKDKAYLEKFNPNTFSLFEEFGNLGVANLSAGIIKGVEKLRLGSSIIDIVDRDIYGRESLVRIENVK